MRNMYRCWVWVPSILLHNAMGERIDIRARVHAYAHANCVSLCSACGLGVKTADAAVLELCL